VFGEDALLERKVAEYLVGGYVMEAKPLLALRIQLSPVAERRLKKAEGSNHIGFDEIARPIDGAIDMSFGRKMHDCSHPLLSEQGRNGLAIGDVPLNETIIRAPLAICEGGQISGVGEFVEVDDAVASPRDQVPTQSRPDKPGTAGHEYR
jgi:hypothetical protein